MKNKTPAQVLISQEDLIAYYLTKSSNYQMPSNSLSSEIHLWNHVAKIEFLVNGAKRSLCLGLLQLQMNGMDRQLRRQSFWLKDSWLWLLREKVLSQYKGDSKPTALDVGCGPGFVMEELSPLLDIQGVDIDQDMVSSCKARSLKVTLGRAEKLPFERKSFDIVYCSFLLLWVRNPKEVIEEMKRVSKGWVICLAEPDYGARIDYPNELSPLHGLIAEGIAKDGGDPFVGRKLRRLFHECGLESEIGVHPGVWTIDRLRMETEDEWRWISMTIGDSEWISTLRERWDEALEEGVLFEYNPIFYALARTSI